MKKIDRDFNISDAVLLEHSEVVVETLPSDMRYSIYTMPQPTPPPENPETPV